MIKIDKNINFFYKKQKKGGTFHKKSDLPKNINQNNEILTYLKKKNDI